MNILRKIAAIVLTLFLTVALFGCRGETDPALAFTTRAVVAVTNNMNSEAERFTISNAEYTVFEDGTRRVIIECNFNMGGGVFERHVFVVGEGGDPFEKALQDGTAVIDTETELCVINRGDLLYNESPDDKVDLVELRKNHQRYINNGNLDILGMGLKE